MRRKPTKKAAIRSTKVTGLAPMVKPGDTPPLRSADAIARDNRTDLFLAVVAPVGIRRDSFEAALGRTLRPFGYRLEMIRLSELIEDFRGVAVDKSTESDRLRTAMTAGSDLRERVGPDALARAAMIEVAGRRSSRKRAAPVAHVFWSLKHPEEVATLRLVYGGAFHLIALFASEADRIDELKKRPHVTDADARQHVARDREEPGKRTGQQTRDTFHRADVFLAWGTKPDEQALARFVDLLFGRPDLTPNADEHRMFLAYANSVRSGELSRQVGATLVSADGDVIALGANDVPRRGGGLHWPDESDDRDAVHGEDSNQRIRQEILMSVAEDIGAENAAELAQKLERTRLKNITEYGRAVHAEMDALLACARSGHSTRRATIFVTTFPCHNCARHIIAAGVRRVVYVEPYPKSLALQLHRQDLTEAEPSTSAIDDRVVFVPYLGIGPRRFLDYFSMHLGDGYVLHRKNDTNGKLVHWNPANAAPRVQSPSVTMQDLEKALGSALVDFRTSNE